MYAKKIYRTALETYGAEHQTKKLFEEIGEFQEALCKYNDGRDTLDHVAEELADVQIMLEQMTILHGCGALVDVWKRLKLEKLAQKIGLEEDK